MCLLRPIRPREVDQVSHHESDQPSLASEPVKSHPEPSTRDLGVALISSLSAIVAPLPDDVHDSPARRSNGRSHLLHVAETVTAENPQRTVRCLEDWIAKLGVAPEHADKFRSTALSEAGTAVVDISGWTTMALYAASLRPRIAA